MIGLRNFLIHEYDKVDDTLFYEILRKNLKDLERIMEILLELALNKAEEDYET